MSRWSDVLADDAVAILLFHGVIETPRSGVRNYTGKHIDAPAFRAILEDLAASGTPVSIDGALRMLDGSDELPPRPFVVTFDDGFRNNLTVAAPILEACGVPATFYVTSGFVNDGACSWIDLIEEAVERSPRSELRLPWSDERLPAASRDERIALLDTVRTVVKQRQDLDPYEVADAVRAEAGVGPFEPDEELDRKLRWDEVAALSANDLFTVGGHSHTHRILAYLDDADLEREVALSIELLAGAIGEPVRHYSYPEGLAHCYSDRVIVSLRRHGVICSPTALPGVNPPGTDPFHLRRFLVA